MDVTENYDTIRSRSVLDAASLLSSPFTTDTPMRIRYNLIRTSVAADAHLVSLWCESLRPRSATESGLFFVGYQPKF